MLKSIAGNSGAVEALVCFPLFLLLALPVVLLFLGQRQIEQRDTGARDFGRLAVETLLTLEVSQVAADDAHTVEDIQIGTSSVRHASCLTRI